MLKIKLLVHKNSNAKGELKTANVYRKSDK